MGYDADTCADYQLVFNSGWPSLPIVYETTISIPYFDGSGPLPTSPTANHNLGYPPLAMGWLLYNGKSYGRIKPNNVGVNTVVFPVNTTFSPSWSILVRCYGIDISKPVEYNYYPPASVKLPYDNTFGIKISKPNKSTDSTDLRNFILHSRAQSPAVLSILTQDSTESMVSNPTTVGGSDLQYTVVNNYTPWLFLYSENIKNKTWNYQGYAAGVNIVNNVITFPNVINSSFPNIGVSAIILRDPLFAPNTINVIF